MKLWIALCLLAVVHVSAKIELYDSLFRLSEARDGIIKVYSNQQLSACPTEDGTSIVKVNPDGTVDGEEAAGQKEKLPNELLPAIILKGPYDSGKTFIANHWLGKDGVAAQLASGIQYTTTGRHTNLRTTALRLIWPGADKQRPVLILSERCKLRKIC